MTELYDLTDKNSFKEMIDINWNVFSDKFDWHPLKTLSDMINIFYNQGIPMIAGVLCVSHHPAWIFIALPPMMFNIFIDLKKLR